MHKISMGNAEQYIGIDVDELNSIVDGLIAGKHSDGWATDIIYTLSDTNGEITMFAAYEWEN